MASADAARLTTPFHALPFGVTPCSSSLTRRWMAAGDIDAEDGCEVAQMPTVVSPRPLRPPACCPLSYLLRTRSRTHYQCMTEHDALKNLLAVLPTAMMVVQWHRDASTDWLFAVWRRRRHLPRTVKKNNAGEQCTQWETENGAVQIGQLCVMSMAYLTDERSFAAAERRKAKPRKQQYIQS